jgi:hypothetical protein
MSAPLPRPCTASIAVLWALWALPAVAQEPNAAPAPASSDAREHALEEHVTQLNQRVQDLENMVRRLQEQLEKATGAGPSSPAVAAAPAAASPGVVTSQSGNPAAPPAPAGAAAQPTAAADDSRSSHLPLGVTVNAMLDGYYVYNFNSPVGRVNDLRANDTTSDSFTLSQADLLLESSPDIAASKRWGMRIDLQFGQETSTLQGNSANEPHPDAYRNIWQAYGTYVFPLAKGLTVDFGKWASSLGMEGNYTKDQLNYSRSLWYDYLPYYHMGLRSKLQVDDVLAIDLWLVNGANQTEDFNGSKDAMLGIVLTPWSGLNWTVDYYQGTEHPNVYYLPNSPPGTGTLPYQEGTYVLPIESAPDGKLRIASTYLTWQTTRSLLLGAQATYTQERLYSYSSPEHVEGGALYARYQFTRAIGLATRAEYLVDADGLFSGTPQHLKEATLTLDYRLADSFLVRGEFRRDESDRRYFLGSTVGILEPQQQTLGFGLVWWFGQKTGPW